jgi:hypothetical protein
VLKHRRIFGYRLDCLLEDVAMAALAAGYVGGFIVILQLALRRLFF